MDGCFLRDHSPLLADSKRSISKVAFAGSRLMNHPSVGVAGSPIPPSFSLCRGRLSGGLGNVFSSLLCPRPFLTESGPEPRSCGGARGLRTFSGHRWDALPFKGLPISPVFGPDSFRDFDELMC